jgi:FkbM family methyltransferase
MIRRIKSLIQSMANRLGYRLVRLDSKPGIPEEWTSRLDTFLSLLAGFGFRPEHIVDVGANRANWTRRAVHFFPSARYTLIEPQESLKQYHADLLQRGVAIKWINAGVADKSGTLALAVGQPDSTSTFYNDGDPHTRRMSVPVLTLNEIAESHGIPNLVKIDAEGFDLRVLVGASKLLGKTDVFLVEVTVCAVPYENTIADVIRFMDERGYKVADITDLNRSPKHDVLWLCELAFVRKGSGLFDVGREYI